jgi:hypothetical protein
MRSTMWHPSKATKKTKHHLKMTLNFYWSAYIGYWWGTSSTIWSNSNAACIPLSRRVKRNSIQINSSVDSKEQFIRWFTQKSSTWRSI